MDFAIYFVIVKVMNDILEEHFLSEEVLLKFIVTYIEQDCARLYE